MDSLIAQAFQDDPYWRMADAERRAPAPPQDMTDLWNRYTPISDSEGRDRDKIRAWATTKGTDIGMLFVMDVRFAATKAGDVWVAYAVRFGVGPDLNPGTVVGIKLRSVGSGRKFCEPGTRLFFPAMPSLYRKVESENIDRIVVCEGESDAAWLMSHGNETDAVYCLHGGAALWDPRWAFPLIERNVPVLVATDNDYDRAVDTRGIQNIGDHLAGQIMADVPKSKRLRPPKPARDWCEVGS